MRSNADTPLMLAARNGNLDQVKMLLEGGAPIDQAKDNGVTALFLAAQENKLEVVKFLLAKNADVNKKKKEKDTSEEITPLCFAVQQGYVNIIQAFLDAGSSVDDVTSHGRTLLFLATISGQIDAVKMLLKNNANFNKPNRRGITPLFAAADLCNGRVRAGNSTVAQSRYEEIVTCLLEAKLIWLLKANANDVTEADLKELKPYKRQLFALIKNLPLVEQKKAANAIFDLSKSNKKNMTTAIGKVMCQGGSDVTKPATQLGGIYQECIKLKLFATEEDEKKERINEFFKAVYANDVNAVEQYITDHYVDLDVVDEKKKDTGLIAAARCGHLDVVKVFLKHGVPVDQTKDDGATVLLLAAEEGYFDVVEELLKAGADVNYALKDGATPLFEATWRGNVEAVKMLLKNKADFNKVDIRGRTLLFIAAIQSYEIVKALNGISAPKSNYEEIVTCLLEAKLNWLLQANASDVTDAILKELKPYKKQLFEFIKKLPTIEEKKQAANAMFDMSKADKKNLTTALGKVMCQGGSDVTKADTQLGGIYKECLALGLIELTKSAHVQNSVFTKREEPDAPDMVVEITAENDVFSDIGDNRL